MATPSVGAEGSITFPAATTQTTLYAEFQITIEQDMHDVSDFTTTGNFTQSMGGQMDIKGTARGMCAATPLPIITQQVLQASQGTAGFVCTLKSGQTYTFTGIISNLNVSVPKSGVAEFTVTFESSGEIS